MTLVWGQILFYIFEFSTNARIYRRNAQIPLWQVKNILIFGASGHGSVILDIVESEGRYQPVGFIDSYKQKGTLKNGYEILGTEFDLPYLIEKWNIYGGIVALGDNWLRAQLVKRVEKIAPGFRFVSAVHPTAYIGRDVRIAEGTAIMPRTVVNANSRVGKHCILNTGSVLEHDGRMENYSSLAPRVCTGGKVSLGYCSAISMGVNIIENIAIGAHSVVGAASLVLHDLPGNVLAYGSPAKIIRTRKTGEPYLTGSKRSCRTIEIDNF